VTETNEIEKIIDEISFIKTKSKNYEDMDVEEISNELRLIMEFEQKAVKKIEEFEQKSKDKDFVEYLKMISKNTTQREISKIQEIYLHKIDEKYLKK
jgi:flagellar motor component MotA